MAKPDVKVIETNGNLGRVGPSEDGISGIIVSGVAIAGQFALGDVLGPFASTADVEALGITAAYDTTNTCMAHKHISDFYDYAGNGTGLYVMVVAKTVTMTDLADRTLSYAKKLLSTTLGKIRLLAITRVPDGAYTPTYTGQFEADLATAIVKAQALVNEEFTLHRPVSIIFEGRNFQGNASSSVDMRDSVAGYNANRVSVMIGNDYDYASTVSYANKYAAAGIALGKAAKNPVQRNIGRVKDGDLGILNAGFSNGAKYSSLSETNTDSLHDHGYMFFRQHAGKAGYFFNDDPVAAPITDDYSSLSAGRTMDKVARITHQVFLEELLDDIELNPDTGKLDVGTIKYYQGEIEKEVNKQMTNNGEIVRVTAFVDPDQNVTATNKVTAEVNVRRKGMATDIEVSLGFEAQSA